ncbi:hypothetical protein H1Q58_14840 [Planococcus maritimus]|uniref:Uncharacterized protein n=1 Tax=Planococcus maritimus TaxID=192421 RepID=A0A7D7MA24_PLAMR|nr:hypothetical protein [Planococcus maritimus]QMT17217.1 hypothetical protein H1Q58_14840 [Planococcus maritimus]
MQRNDFVDYLDQYNVLSPNHSKIYDEYTYEDDELSKYAFSIETNIEEYLIEIFKENPRSIILSGNAGDGKTRLCRRVFNSLTSVEMQSWSSEGIVDVTCLNNQIIIVKDLSELSENKIQSILMDLEISIKEKKNKYYLIAANEGKLTQALTQEGMDYLQEKVRKRFESHINNDQELGIINLQDVTSSVYAERIIKEWTKKEYWNQCESCPLSQDCIIFHNYEKLKEPKIQKKLVNQYRTLDYLSEHITMREMLIHLAYTITGSLKCDDIYSEDMELRDAHFNKVYYENYYGASAINGQAEKIQALKALRTIDPGNYSFSTIDDFIINGDISGDPKLESEHFSLIDDSIDLQRGYFKNQLNMYRDHNEKITYEDISFWIYKLRRKLFFEANEELFAVEKLLPFEYIKDFKEIMSENKINEFKKMLVPSLNRSFSRKLIDPIFVKNLYAINETLLIKNTFKRGELILEIEPTREEIDHLPSKLILKIKGNEEIKLNINLAVFEYLMRLHGGGTHNILKNEVEILVDTFRNELMTLENEVGDDLEILKYDYLKGLYIESELSID